MLGAAFTVRVKDRVPGMPFASVTRKMGACVLPETEPEIVPPVESESEAGRAPLAISQESVPVPPVATNVAEYEDWPAVAAGKEAVVITGAAFVVMLKVPEVAVL